MSGPVYQFRWCGVCQTETEHTRVEVLSGAYHGFVWNCPNRGIHGELLAQQRRRDAERRERGEP